MVAEPLLLSVEQFLQEENKEDGGRGSDSGPISEG